MTLDQPRSPITRLLLFSALLLIASPALAQFQTGPSSSPRESGREKVGVYSYAEITYQRLGVTQPDGSSREANGVALAGSYEVIRHTYVFADYRLFRDAGRSNSLDLQEAWLGAGFAFPVARPLDLFVQGSLLRNESERCIDGSCQDINSSGVGLGVGAWIALNPGGGIRISWTEQSFDRDDARGNPVQRSGRLIELGIHSRHSGHSIVLGGQAYSDANSFRIGYRYTF